LTTIDMQHDPADETADRADDAKIAAAKSSAARLGKPPGPVRGKRTLPPMHHGDADSSHVRRAVPVRHDWPPAQRPRERLLAGSAATLSDVELLAAFFRTGSRGASALDLARRLLGHFEGLHPLLHADRQALQALPGIGAARVAQLRAAHEMTRRALAERLRAFPLVNSPAAVRDYLRLSLATLPHEVFTVLFLDAQHRLLASEEMFRGTLTQTSVYPREVVKRALAHNAGAVILAHNHPSGVAEPSRADELLTQSLSRALDLVDVRVLDHVIVAGDASVSFAERGLL
jgi:DNA repair protein RadC